MRLLTSLRNYLLIGWGNALPRFHFFNRLRPRFYRSAGLRIGKGVTILGPLRLDLSARMNALPSISIGDRTYLNAETRFAYQNSRICIGEDCLIGPRVSFETETHNIIYDPERKRGSTAWPILIKDKVWIGAGATILPGVTIHEGAVVAAGAIVSNNVDAYTLVGGVPARKIRDIARS